MNINEFETIIRTRFPNLSGRVWSEQLWSKDGSISYCNNTKQWCYFLSKSTAGRGNTLDEAISNAEKRESEDLNDLYG